MSEKQTAFWRHTEQIQNARRLFSRAFGTQPPRLVSAPARINILGEHVDYVSYLPTASLTFGSHEHAMVMAFQPTNTNRVRGFTTLSGCDPIDFDLPEVDAERAGHDTANSWEHYLFTRPAPAPGWDNYVKGAAAFARFKFGKQIRRGFDFVVDSSIPAGGGASSSSALTVLAGAALRLANEFPLQAAVLACDSALAEWFLGTRGGAMDHKTICLSQAGQIVYLDYGANRECLVPFHQPPFRWVTFFTEPADKSREIMLEYNERAAVGRILIPALLEARTQADPTFRQSWRLALEILAVNPSRGHRLLESCIQRLPETITLAQAQRRLPTAFEQCRQAFPALARERFGVPLKIRNRAFHHLGEVRRVAAALQVLEAARGLSPQPSPDAVEALHKLGGLLNQSHSSLRDLYDVSTPQVERLVQFLGAHGEVLGARLMGGGFGGNVLVLTREEHLAALLAVVQAFYYEPLNRNGRAEGSIMVSTPGPGLQEI